MKFSLFWKTQNLPEISALGHWFCLFNWCGMHMDAWKDVSNVLRDTLWFQAMVICFAVSSLKLGRSLAPWRAPTWPWWWSGNLFVLPRKKMMMVSPTMKWHHGICDTCFLFGLSWTMHDICSCPAVFKKYFCFVFLRPLYAGFVIVFSFVNWHV